METSKLEELPSYGNFQVRETSKLEKLPSYGNFQVMAKWTQCHRSLGNAKLRHDTSDRDDLSNKLLLNSHRF
jgi:hypothetical protein